jgi:hypothetical protein
MTDTQTIRPAPQPPTAIPSWRRVARRVGLLLAVVMSAAVGLLALVPATSQSAQLLLVSLALLPGLGLLAAAGLLIAGYHEFFGRGRGVVAWMAVFLLAVYLTNEPVSPESGPVVSIALTIAAFWGFVAALAIGPTLLLYLIRSDRSVIVFAATYLLLVWLMFSLGQYLGWETMLQRLVFGRPGEILWPLQGLLCGGIWVTIAATVAFAWNTAVYLYREWAGVQPYEAPAPAGEEGTSPDRKPG